MSPFAELLVGAGCGLFGLLLLLAGWRP